MARMLLTVGDAQRVTMCRFVFDRADEALTYARTRRRVHPVWGNGSLDAVARAMGVTSEPFWDDLAYLRCLNLVLKELEARLRGR